MKHLFTLTLIFGCAVISAKAQTVATSPVDALKQKPLDKMDSLSWHMPKTSGLLNQLQLNKLGGLTLGKTPADSLKSEIVYVGYGPAVSKVYSTMPVKRLDSNDKMPVDKLQPVGDKITKKVIVIDPLAEVPKP